MLLLLLLSVGAWQVSQLSSQEQEEEEDEERSEQEVDEAAAGIEALGITKWMSEWGRGGRGACVAAWDMWGEGGRGTCVAFCRCG